MTEIDEETLRDQLKAKQNSLQKEFHMNPSNTRLALEIRLIDDLIASHQYPVTSALHRLAREPTCN